MGTLRSVVTDQWFRSIVIVLTAAIITAVNYPSIELVVDGGGVWFFLLLVLGGLIVNIVISFVLAIAKSRKAQ